MYFENYYYNNNSISNYKIIMNKFINRYLALHKEDINKKTIRDAILYSKYFLEFKTKNCIYDEKIMDIIHKLDY